MAESLWKLRVDARTITAAEFKNGLLQMREAGAWLRFALVPLPQQCAFCQEVSKVCQKCTRRASRRALDQHQAAEAEGA